MAIFRCLSLLRGWKKEKKVGKESPASAELNKGLKTLNLRLEHPVKPLESNGFKTASFRLSVPVDVEKNLLEVKVMNHGSLNVDEGAEIAYEGEDEHEENASLKRELSDFDFSRYGATTEEGECTRVSEELGDFDSSDPNMFCQFATNPGKDTEGLDLMQGGHISDPGIGRANFWGSPMLKRSCSNLETGRVQRRLADRLPNLKSQNSVYLEIPERSSDLGSPASFTSHQSADRVILKRHSSLQVLPSRSRRLWWKLFLWSHRNLHKPCTVKPKQETVSILVNQQGGYYSDTLEPNQATASSTMQSPSSINGESLNLGNNDSKCNDKNWDGPHLGMSEMWPQNQWVAFSGESYPFARVDEWVRDLETEAPPIDSLDNIDDQKGKGIFFPPSPERSSVLAHRPDINLSEEILHANAMILSLNSSSTVAHIFGIGLRVVPTLSCFSSLRSVNLSSNFIANIAPGSLPKGLHTLNLSRNKISTIEGLRELTRLRLLDLSYNRISRIGQGLSNCTTIKELYLAGNKISDVEGLHRLLKLTVLDLSFNKISTTKALGQLVANYNTLQALNLLGNPVLSNISEDQLRKAVCSLLPKLVYLSKQPIKPQRARVVLTDSVAKAALGSSGSWGSRQRASKKVSSMVTTSSVRGSGSSTMHKSKYGSKSRTGNLKAGSPSRASSSRQNVPPFGTQL